MFKFGLGLQLSSVYFYYQFAISLLSVFCTKCLKINKGYYYYYYVLCVSTLFLCNKVENKYGGDPSTCQTHFDYTTPQFRYILCTLYTYIYLGLCRILFPTWQIKKIKIFLIMINLNLWYFLKTCNYYKIILKTLCYLSQYGICDGRVWVSYSWYHCCLENLFQNIQNSSYHPQCFICLIKLKILIMIIKAIYSVLSLFKMS